MQEQDRDRLLTAEDAPCPIDGIEDLHDHRIEWLGRRKWELGERHSEILDALSHEELPLEESSRVSIHECSGAHFATSVARARRE